MSPSPTPNSNQQTGVVASFVNNQPGETPLDHAAQHTASTCPASATRIQPDLGLPAAGFLDALVLDPLNALTSGQTQSGFNVTFDYIGQSLPGALPFTINDANFNVLFSGTTTTVPGVPTGGQIPEPGAVWLMLLAAGCLAATRVKWTTRHAAPQTESAAVMQEVA